MEDIYTEKRSIDPFEVGILKISFYEDALEVMAQIEDGKYLEAFKRVFFTPDLLANEGFDYFHCNLDPKRVQQTRDKYKMDMGGAMLLSVLDLNLLTANPLTRVRFPSIESLITKDSGSPSGLGTPPSPEGTDDLLKDGFTH